MHKDDLNLLKLDIICKRIVNFKDIIAFGNNCLNNYFNCIMVFGTNNKVTKDTLKLFKEFYQILKEEEKMFNILLKNYRKLDANEINEFMFEIYNLSEETLLYYYKALEDIDTACCMEVEWKAKRPIKTFKTLIESDEYYKKVCGLLLEDKDIEDFLKYPEEFWQYIDIRTIIVDSHIPEEREFYGVNLKMCNNKLSDIKVFVPEIINLETALINIHEFRIAYNLYQELGNAISKEDSWYELSGIESVKEFKKSYFKNKCRNIFK